MEVFSNKEVDKFIASLDRPTRGKTLRIINLLEQFGPSLRMPISKKVILGIFELRIRGKQEVRIFYCFFNDGAYLLSGFIKKSSQTPKKEIQKTLAKYRALTLYNL
jgi:phage-related protein